MAKPFYVFQSSDAERVSCKTSLSSTCSDCLDEHLMRAVRRQSVLCDPESMKERIRQSMARPKYDVSVFYKKKGFCPKVATSQKFEYATLSVIFFNAVWIAVDTDLNDAEMLLNAHPVFQLVEHFFCVYFAFEWTIRFGAFQRKVDGLRDAWFTFDSIMVFVMVSETWVLNSVLLVIGGTGAASGMGDAAILRLLRLLRLSRMARMAKLLRSMPELLILIKGILSALKSLGYTLGLLTILIYVFAIAFRSLTDGLPSGELYFGNFWAAAHTLLLDGTLLDNTGNVVRALQQDSVANVMVFYLFILLAALTIMNMLIGVLCEVVSGVAASERENITVSMVKDGFMSIICKGGLDTNGDMQISKGEFLAILDDPEACKLLESVEVDAMSLIDLADFIFTKEVVEDSDEEDEGKPLSFPDFMEVVLSLRGSNRAKVSHIMDLRKAITASLHHLEDKYGFAPRKAMYCPQERRALTAPMTPPPLMLPSLPGAVSSLELPGIVPSPREHPPGLMRSSPDCSPSSAARPQAPLWARRARLVGLLAATQSEIQHFLEELPPPRARRVCSNNRAVEGVDSIGGNVFRHAGVDLVKSETTPSMTPSTRTPSREEIFRVSCTTGKQQDNQDHEDLQPEDFMRTLLTRLGNTLAEGTEELNEISLVGSTDFNGTFGLPRSTSSFSEAWRRCSM